MPSELVPRSKSQDQHHVVYLEHRLEIERNMPMERTIGPWRFQRAVDEMIAAEAAPRRRAADANCPPEVFIG